MPPCIRINGELVPVNAPVLKQPDLEFMILSIIKDYQKEKLEHDWELDFSYAISGHARFRGNVMFQRGTLAAVFRAVPFIIPEFDNLGLPNDVKRLCDLPRGLVLVTGPTGSGKSTTLAAMINMINNTRASNIVTVEDPIEFYTDITSQQLDKESLVLIPTVLLLHFATFYGMTQTLL